MNQPSSNLNFHRVRPPVRRVLAIDPGTRCIRFLLLERDFGRLRIEKSEVIDLKGEGLLAGDELKTHIQTTLDALDEPAVALVLPQHVSTSQLIDLPLVQEGEVQKLVEEESVKLSGVSDSRIVYDFVRAGPAVRNRQRFWVTLCQERDIRERIEKLGLDQHDLCEVTTTANALIAAYRAAAPLSSRAILVHAGAQSTVVVILLEGQGVFATSFQMGGDFFTRSLARLRECTEEAAETLKARSNLLTGPEAQPGFAAVVDGWVGELKRQLNEWFAQNPGVAEESAPMELIASGGTFDQPGLLDYLKQSGVPFRPWPGTSRADFSLPAPGFEVAFGTALQALGQAAQPVSLLPVEYRAAWRKRLSRQRLEFASVVLAVICLVLLGLATWRHGSLLHNKRELLAKARSGVEMMEEQQRLTRELTQRYETLRPLFARQQNTIDTLKALALLQQSRSNQNFWYVMLADQYSYFSHPAAPLTNRPASRADSILPLGSLPFAPVIYPVPPTNMFSPASPGFIAELCIPGNAQEARTLLSDLVAHLKTQPLFSKVDLLSDDLRRNLADPKVVIPDRHYVLELDFAQTGFHSALPVETSRATTPGRPASRRAWRPAWTSNDSASRTYSSVMPQAAMGSVQFNNTAAGFQPGDARGDARSTGDF